MSVLSTVDTPISSRTFDARTMKDALKKMPSSERAEIYSLVAAIDEKTGIGYYAAMDFVANLGLFFANPRTKST